MNISNIILLSSPSVSPDFSMISLNSEWSRIPHSSGEVTTRGPAPPAPAEKPPQRHPAWLQQTCPSALPWSDAACRVDRPEGGWSSQGGSNYLLDDLEWIISDISIVGWFVKPYFGGAVGILNGYNNGMLTPVSCDMGPL